MINGSEALLLRNCRRACSAPATAITFLAQVVIRVWQGDHSPALEAAVPRTVFDVIDFLPYRPANSGDREGIRFFRSRPPILEFDALPGAIA
jgi:hypothetical protein